MPRFTYEAPEISEIADARTLTLGNMDGDTYDSCDCARWID
jgi:hypothetical protein